MYCETDLQLTAVVCFFKAGSNQAFPLWDPTGAGGAALSELRVLRFRRCSLESRTEYFSHNFKKSQPAAMTEPVVIILISYDKFTQCNKDLAEHNFADFVLKLCNNTSWPSSELKKKMAKATGKWSYAGSSEDAVFQGCRWPRIPTNWEICFEDSDILIYFCQSIGVKGIQCRVALCMESLLGIWEVRDSISYCDYFFRANYFFVLYLALVFVFCMCVFCHLPF